MENVDKKSFFANGSGQFINFASLGKLILQDLKKKNQETLVKNYKKEDIIKFLDSPDKFIKQLRDISKVLYNKSPHYKRAINYFAKMPTFAYIVEPYGIDIEKANVKTIRTQYQKVCDFLDLMNIKHEFLKILLTGFKEDIFFGYEYMTKDSYFIQKLNPDYCMISSIEDGVYNFAFNFRYFDSNKDKLPLYDKEFQSKYNLFKSGKAPDWQELDSTKTICIKVNEDVEYPIPPLVGVFEDIFDIFDFKKLRKVDKQLGNYKILVQKLPMLKESEGEVDAFAIQYDTMMKFHNQALSTLPEEIGVITSPMDIVPVDFSKNMKDEDIVGDAERGYWSGVGVSQLLFNTDKSSSIGLDFSIKTDEQVVFGVLRQIERWINRRLKTEFNSLKFRINILNITYFNEDEYFERALKGAQFGLPTKTIATASLGISPSAMISLAFLENDVLGLHEKLIPLSSSHTQDGQDPSASGGRPKSKKVSDAGLKTRDGEKNKRRA